VKRQIIVFGILALLLFATHNVFADRSGFVRKVVIDPGHGGRDPGAIGAISKEKDLVLAIALKLGGYIKENFDDVEVIYTRTTDVFVPLHERAQIANDSKADLFISLHCNASRGGRALGTETFVMGSHRNKENLEVARKENASILFEDDYIETYDGYDPNSPEANIIFTLFQNAHIYQSLTMASLVQDQFRTRAARHDRGVKQAGFLVLYRVAMPAILVEAGFLSNPQEERYLVSETGQAHIASAIFRAFREYKNYQDNLARPRLLANGSSGQPQSDSRQQDQSQISQESVQPTSENPVSSQTILSQNLPVISFRVQFASTSRELPPNAPEFKGLQGVSFYFQDGLYKYTLGDERTIEDAAKIQKKLHDQGFNDAFVVAFKNDERITAQQAIQIINQRIQNP
jgi:N-acetylmuramoyl-L-alanine amidase